MENNFERHSDALNLGIESDSGISIALEGDVERRLKFSMSNEYPESILKPHTSTSGYLFEWQSNQRNMISLLNHSLVQMYDNMSDEIKSLQSIELENEKQKFTPYRKSNQYSYVYTASDGKSAWESFKQEQMIEYVDGSASIKLDGVMVIIGEVNFDQEITYEGKGVILALNGVRISANIKRRGIEDILVIVTRGVKSDFALENDVLIEAFLMGHKLGTTGQQKVSFEAGASSNVFEVDGGMSFDTLSINDMPEGSSIRYNPMYGQEYFHLSVAYPIHYYKVDNKEKRQMMEKATELN